MSVSLTALSPYALADNDFQDAEGARIVKERTGSDLPAHSRKIAALAVLGGASLTVGVYRHFGAPSPVVSPRCSLPGRFYLSLPWDHSGPTSA